MVAIDSLPGDQRAVLQLVLGRGRSYEEIARLLSINPDAVRERAQAATDALGPQTSVPVANRHLICDYLLGQLAAHDTPMVQALLADSAPERGWARMLSAELAPMSAGPLPEIPLSGGEAPAPNPPPAPPTSPSPARPTAAVTPAADAPPAPGPATVALGAAAADAEPAPAAKAPRGRRRGRTAGNSKSAKPTKPSRTQRRAAAAAVEADKVQTSRRGGMVVIAISVLVIAVVIFVVTRHHHSNTATASAHVTQTNPASATQTSSSVSSASTTASSSSAHVVAQINLSAASSGSKAAAIADVLQEGTQREVAIVGQNMPANTKHNSYEVWLYNSPSNAVSLGFVDPGVSANGKLSAAGALPANASSYHELIVTTETVAKPTAPGPIVLAGTISGL